MTTIQLQSNERGNAILCPITEYQVRLASNDMVILVLQYVESIEQFDAGQCKQLQTVIPATRALEIAATLKKAANMILEADSVPAVH